MANVIVMSVPKDKLQKEIECKVIDGWTLRRKKENIAVLTRRSGWENLLIYLALSLLTLESLHLVYRWIDGKKER